MTLSVPGTTTLAAISELYGIIARNILHTTLRFLEIITSGSASAAAFPLGRLDNAALREFICTHKLTIVELHGLVGSRACLILSRVLAQPKVEVIGQRLGLRVFLVCLKRGNPR